MNKSEILERRGFVLEKDLGINADCAGWFFQFDGQTFAFDEEGKTWIWRGFIDPGEIFFFATDPILWEPRVIS
ncbi:MAG TPA: hypothetical protein VJH25_02400 [Candidatus Paceibacterota bacterium]